MSAGTTLKDQHARDRIRTDLKRNIIVEASAGTGKTEAMTGRMVELVATDKGAIAHIAAVTFTRKAAAELRNRFRLRLEKEAGNLERDESQRGNLAEGLARIDACYIGTIHSFCARLLRERPVEAGIDAAFSEIDDRDDKDLRDQAFDECLNQLHADDQDPLLGRLMEQDVDTVALKPAFSDYAGYPDVKDWPDPVPLPDREVANKIRQVLDYAAYMAGMGEKLPDDSGNDALIPNYRIIPRIVRHHGKVSNLAQCEPILRRLCTSPGIVQKIWVGTGNFTKDDAISERAKWEEFQARVALPLMAELRRRRYPLVRELMERAMVIYDQLREQQHALNFQDLLMEARRLLLENPGTRSDFQQRYRHILVDEFQDTDPIQAEMLFLLTGRNTTEIDWRKCQPAPGSLFIVGDPKQSIYRFRRADILTYQEVCRLLLEGSGEDAGIRLHLSANFRATPEMIKGVNEIFRAPKGMPQTAADGDEMVHFPEAETRESPEYVDLEPGRPGVKAIDIGGIMRLDVPPELKNQESICSWESAVIARYIRKAVDEKFLLPPRPGDENETPRPADFGDFLIVTRNTHRLNYYADALARYNIPHQVTGGSSLDQVDELGLLRLALLAVAHPDNPVYLLAVLRSELFGVSDRDLFFLKDAGGRFNWHSDLPSALPEASQKLIAPAFESLRRYAGWFANLPAAAAMERMAGELGLIARAAAVGDGNARAGGLMKAIELARAAERDSWSPAQLADYLVRLADAEDKHDSIPARPPSESVVRVMNLHKVKGLEAPVVFLADPNGDGKHEPHFHIRRADKVTGHMVFKSSTEAIAEPGDWERLSAEESSFQRAEELRLRYVAATRAGVALIISFREKSKEKNPWRHFAGQAKTPFPVPEEFDPPASDEATIGEDEPMAAAEVIARRFAVSVAPTRRVASVRELVLSPHISGPAGKPDHGVVEGEHGLEWGALMHSTLQAAMDRPDADVAELAAAFAREQGLDAAIGAAAAGAAKKIVTSEIWRRARKSPERFTELPFEMVKETAEGPVLVRGVMDLIFREGDDWVLIDYKTDLLNRRKATEVAEFYRPQLQLYSEAFTRLTGGRVSEAGFYFVRDDLVQWVKV